MTMQCKKHGHTALTEGGRCKVCDYMEPINDEVTSAFELLVDDQKTADRIDGMILTALHNCAKRIYEIAAQYPHAGVADTASREEIVDHFHQLL